MDHIALLPSAYGCAVEMLNNGERTAARLNGLIEHYEVATGLQATPSMLPHLSDWRAAALRIAGRRYWDFKA